MIEDLLEGLGEAVVGAVGEVVGVAAEWGGEVVAGAVDVAGDILDGAGSAWGEEEEEARKKGART